MKKVSLIALFVMLCGAANAATYGASSVADLTHGPGTRTRTTVNYEKYETRESGRTYVAQNPNVGVRRASTANLYYTEPARRAVVTPDTTRMSVRSGEATATMRRKYYLAHPFFQPLAGKFGLVLDAGYAKNSFDYDVEGIAPLIGASYDMTQMSAKLDLSFGISDSVAILGMARYDATKYKFGFSDSAVDDEFDDNGLNIFGGGLQWRWADNDNWIGMLGGYFQHQVDTANTFILDLKAGYKVGRSTFYGLARGWYVDFEGSAYGIGVTDGDKSMFMAYETDKSDATYWEGGIGIFSVLAEDWTANLEAVYGGYDWHNQLSVKAAIGWQPEDSFALNLYGKIALYDTAENEDVSVFWKEPGAGLPDLTPIGFAKIDGYSEYSIGLQAIFYF